MSSWDEMASDFVFFQHDLLELDDLRARFHQRLENEPFVSWKRTICQSVIRSIDEFLNAAIGRDELHSQLRETIAWKSAAALMHLAQNTKPVAQQACAAPCRRPGACSATKRKATLPSTAANRVKSSVAVVDGPACECAPARF